MFDKVLNKALELARSLYRRLSDFSACRLGNPIFIMFC